MLEMNDVLNDKDLLGEVMKNPDVYGITYTTNKGPFDEIERLCKFISENRGC